MIEKRRRHRIAITTLADKVTAVTRFIPFYRLKTPQLQVEDTEEVSAATLRPTKNIRANRRPTDAAHFSE